MKKWFMRQRWRLMQVSSVTSLLFWVVALTGIWSPLLQKYVNVSMSVLMPVTALSSLFFVLVLGWAWDHLRLWHDEQVVIAERNPYAQYLLTPLWAKIVPLWVEQARVLERLAVQKGFDVRPLNEAVSVVNGLKSRAKKKVGGD